MSNSTSPHPVLEIVVYQVGGAVARFAQDDPQQAANILQTIQQPHKFFGQPFHQIGGDNSVSVFRSDQLTRIDFLLDDTPTLPYLNGATSIREVPREEFDRQFDPEAYAQHRAEVWNKPNTPQVGFVQLDIPHLEPVIWEVTMQSIEISAYDIGPFINHLLSSGGLWAHRADRGVMLINPANVCRATFLPGPTQLPDTAWRATRILG